MRGKESKSLRMPLESRITPAYAGKSSENGLSVILFRDHPRLCGEKSSVTKKPTGDLGSPPPMRGKARFAHYGERGERDHPRLCGEKTGKLIFWNWV